MHKRTSAQESTQGALEGIVGLMLMVEGKESRESTGDKIMRARLTSTMWAVPLLLMLGGTAVAQQVKPSCTNDSRECLLTVAKSYLHAIVTHDGSKALFAPNVRRTVRGHATVGENAMRRSMNMEPDMLPDRNTRYFVDEVQSTVIFFTLLPVKGANADPKRETYERKTPGKAVTVHLVERFRVEGGLITEIEGITYTEDDTLDGESGWPD